MMGALVAAAFVAVGTLGLMMLVLLEIGKFNRWSERRFREHTRRHVKAIRALNEQRTESARRPAESTLGAGRVINSGQSPDGLGA